jgi:hypothetical protein
MKCFEKKLYIVFIVTPICHFFYNQILRNNFFESAHILPNFVFHLENLS